MKHRKARPSMDILFGVAGNRTEVGAGVFTRAGTAKYGRWVSAQCSIMIFPDARK